MAARREKDIDDLPKNSANYMALTPMWFLERAATVHPTRASVVHGSRTYTWQHTYHRCRRLASALSNRSVGLGSTVHLSLSLSVLGSRENSIAFFQLRKVLLLFFIFYFWFKVFIFCRVSVCFVYFHDKTVKRQPNYLWLFS